MSRTVRSSRHAVLLCALLTAFAGFIAHPHADPPGSGPGGAGHEPVARSANPGTLNLDEVGSGELLWKSPFGLVPLPVVTIDVGLAVTGIMLRGMVTQTFSNPTAEVIEAIYVFPLPERASVDAMQMRVGDRTIVAVVQEKEQAAATYEKAKREGRKGSLLDQRRPNLFVTSVANINPGESVTVRLEYLDEVSYRDGVFDLVYPLTYTPRYSPARSSGADSVGWFSDAGGPSVPRARIAVHLDAGFALESVVSPSHAIAVAKGERDRAAGHAAEVTLPGGPVVADRDFILRWSVFQGGSPAGAAFIEDRQEGRYGLVMLLPPESGNGSGMPTRTLFIIDVSGSMEGPSIRQARRALLAALDRLRHGDTFNMVRFSDWSAAFDEQFVSPVGGTMEAARAWVGSLEAGGGTNILPALTMGMRMMGDSDPWPAQRIVLITDGAIGNEDEAFSAIVEGLGQARLHIIGIGAAPNRYLMRKMARFGRGTFESIAGVDEVEAKMTSLLTRIERPVLTDLSLEWDGPSPVETYPDPLPDLHAGDPLFVSLFIPGTGTGRSGALRGQVDGQTIRLGLDVGPRAPARSGVASRWARAKVASLVDSLHEGAEPESVRGEVIEVAKAFNLVTRYTSLVAVEELPSAEGTSTTRRLASALPNGMNLPDGVLPSGGTSGPLVLLVGAILITAGAVLRLLARRSGYPRP